MKNLLTFIFFDRTDIGVSTSLMASWSFPKFLYTHNHNACAGIDYTFFQSTTSRYQSVPNAASLHTFTGLELILHFHIPLHCIVNTDWEIRVKFILFCFWFPGRVELDYRFLPLITLRRRLP